MRKLLFLLLLCVPSLRAQTVVQHPNGATNTTGGTAFSITLTSTASGEQIYVACYTTNTTDPTITDSGSGAWTKDASAQFTSPSNRLAVYSRNTQSSGITSVTVTPPASQFSICFVVTATGMATTGFDKSSTHQTTTGTTFSSNATTTLAQATELAIGMGATGNTGTATLAASGSWTNAAAQVDNSGDGDAGRAMYQVLSATTGIAATGTCGSGDQPVVAIIATYKASGGGGGASASQVGAFAVGP